MHVSVIIMVQLYSDKQTLTHCLLKLTMTPSFALTLPLPSSHPLQYTLFSPSHSAPLDIYFPPYPFKLTLMLLLQDSWSTANWDIYITETELIPVLLFYIT